MCWEQKPVKVFGREPLKRQLDIALAILHGEDVIGDVRNRKTLCISFPLLCKHYGLTVHGTYGGSGESNFDDFVRQTNACRLRALSYRLSQSLHRLCLALDPRNYEDTANKKFRQVIVSPKIVVSESFRREVLSKKEIPSAVASCVHDEAHRISLWGGSFRPDFASLGGLSISVQKANVAPSLAHEHHYLAEDSATPSTPSLQIHISKGPSFSFPQAVSQ